MKRIFILEGPDGGGKSTLAAQLERQLAGPVITTHHGPYREDGATVWRRYLTSMLTAYADLAHVVLDRSWLSEPIYGAVYRGGANRIDAAERRMLERVALGRSAGLVLCRPGWAACEASFRARKEVGGEMLDDTAQLRAVYDAYKQLELASLFQGGVFAEYPALYNYEQQTPGGVIEQLRLTPMENLGPGIGAWRPGQVALIVGERPGGFGGRWHLPFVSLTEGGCSAWLANQLEAADIAEHDLYWINAYDGPEERGAACSSDWVDALQPKLIVALGEGAGGWCVKRNLGHVQVSHPQHHKRFKHRQAYPLIKELTACLRT